MAKVGLAKVGFDSSVGRGRSGHSKPQIASARSAPQEFKPSRTPEVAVSEAVGEVKKLEAAIVAFGEDSVHAKGLHEALRVASARSTLPPCRAGGVQEVLGVGEVEGREGPRRDRQGHCPEKDSRGGSGRRGAKAALNSRPKRPSLWKFLHKCQYCRVRSMH